MEPKSEQGRPSIYNQELATEICIRLARGESLRRICKSEGMPHVDTVLRWAMDSKHPFYDQYARARDMQADTLADEIQDIADDGSNDFIMTSKGLKVDHEHIHRSKLRVDARKWIASKLKPKKYGEKITQELTGPNGKALGEYPNTPELRMLNDEEAAKKLLEIAKTKQLTTSQKEKS